LHHAHDAIRALIHENPRGWAMESSTRPVAVMQILRPQELKFIIKRDAKFGAASTAALALYEIRLGLSKIVSKGSLGEIFPAWFKPY
jgi:hypothetical protein